MTTAELDRIASTVTEELAALTDMKRRTPEVVNQRICDLLANGQQPPWNARTLIEQEWVDKMDERSRGLVRPLLEQVAMATEYPTPISSSNPFDLEKYWDAVEKWARIQIG